MCITEQPDTNDAPVACVSYESDASIAPLPRVALRGQEKKISIMKKVPRIPDTSFEEPDPDSYPLPAPDSHSTLDEPSPSSTRASSASSTEGSIDFEDDYMPIPEWSGTSIEEHEHFTLPIPECAASLNDSDSESPAPEPASVMEVAERSSARIPSRRVHFASSPPYTHSVQPYSEVYGMHPRLFDFDQYGEKILNANPPPAIRGGVRALWRDDIEQWESLPSNHGSPRGDGRSYRSFGQRDSNETLYSCDTYDTPSTWGDW